MARIWWSTTLTKRPRRGRTQAPCHPRPTGPSLPRKTGPPWGQPAAPSRDLREGVRVAKKTRSVPPLVGLLQPPTHPPQAKRRMTVASCQARHQERPRFHLLPPKLHLDHPLHRWDPWEPSDTPFRKDWLLPVSLMGSGRRFQEGPLIGHLCLQVSLEENRKWTTQMKMLENQKY